MNKGKIIKLLLIVFLFSVLFIYNKYDPKANAVEKELESEFFSIQPMPGAELFKKSHSHKTNQALVSASYITNKSFDEILAFYDDELIRNGWGYAGEEGLREWGKDLGGKAVYYQKNGYTASIQYAGEKANYSWTYAIDFSWGLHK
ncbi:MAG: hypothetical protein ACM3UU_07080 [Ignavibacteriales bacterium]